MWTKQSAFDKAWEHFVIQKNPPGFKSQRPNRYDPWCAYITESGARCVIGILLTPVQLEEYGSRNCGVNFLIKSEPEIKVSFKDPTDSYWSELQGCHDSALETDFDRCGTLTPQELEPFHANFKNRMIKLAEEHNLIIPKEENNVD